MITPVRRLVRLSLVLAFTTSLGSAALAQTPAPDPLGHFAADVAAVFDAGAPKPRLLLSETDHSVTSTRVLEIGEEYLDGWMFEAFANRTVTLKKGAQTRAIALTGRTQIAENLAATAKAAAEAAEKAVRAREALPKTLTLAEAIAAKNVAAIVAAGGTAEQAAEALRASGMMVGNTAVDPKTAAYVQGIGGDTGINMRAVSGAPISIFGDFAAYIPPNGWGTLPFSTDNNRRTAAGPFVEVTDWAMNLPDAIADNDIRQIIRQGGSVLEISTAAANQGITAGGAPLVPSSGRMITNALGDNGLSIASTNGTRITMWGWQFAEFTPRPGDAPAPPPAPILLPNPSRVSPVQ